MKCVQKCFAACLLLLACATLPAQEIHFPLIQALAWIPAAESRLLPAGGRAWQLDIADASIFSFSRDREVINDLTVLSFTLSYRRGISRVLTFEVYGGFRFHYDAGIDRFINKVDSMLGFSNSGRDVFPEPTIHYKFKDYFYYERDQWVPAPLVLGLTGRVFRAGDLTLNGRLNIGIPLSNLPGFSSKKIFALAGLMGEYARNKMSLSASLTMAFFEKPAWLAEEDVDHFYFEASLRIRLSNFLLGTIFRSSPLHFAENGNSAKTIYIAFLIKNRLEIGFMEDLPPMDTVPDVAVYLKIHLNRLQP